MLGRPAAFIFRPVVRLKHVLAQWRVFYLAVPVKRMDGIVDISRIPAFPRAVYHWL